jgi:tyrosine-specific transport protein
MIKGKSLGSVLMVLGTSLGAGMIALPVAAAAESFSMTLLLLVSSWFIMTLGALMILEVNLWTGKGSNFIGMSGKTLGRIGQLTSWVAYLLLMYALLCAYLGGMSDVVNAVLGWVHLYAPHFIEVLLAFLLLGYVVFRGIASADLANRVLLGIKLLAYGVAVSFIAPHIQGAMLTQGIFAFHFNTLMVIITSFGYATILPTLVDYLDRDHQKTHRVVWIGSAIPLFIYIIWIAVVQGIIPRDTLMAIANGQGRTVVALLHAIANSGAPTWVEWSTNIFMSICAFTSFLGVSIGLVDFLSDGLKLPKQGSKGLIVYALAFLPPIVIVLLQSNIFIKALAYAGICCVWLLVILPALMVLFGRHGKRYTHAFRVPGGIAVLLTVLSIGIALIVAMII